METDLVIIVTPRLIAPVVPGQRLASPLNSRLPANDVDFFLIGQMEVRKRYNDYVNSGGDIKGPYGHLIAPEVQPIRAAGPLRLTSPLSNPQIRIADMCIRWLAVLAPLLLAPAMDWRATTRWIVISNALTPSRMSAGDAKQINAVTHTINPWPRYVGDRLIVTDARRTGAAITRYGNTQRPIDQLPDIGDATKAIGQPPPTNQNVNISGGGAAGVSVPVGGGR